MKSKIVKQLDDKYYIQMKQLAPEYEAFFELKKKGWLWDSLIVWGDTQDQMEEHYRWIMNNINSYNNM